MVWKLELKNHSGFWNYTKTAMLELQQVQVRQNAEYFHRCLFERAAVEFAFLPISTSRKFQPQKNWRNKGSYWRYRLSHEQTQCAAPSVSAAWLNGLVALWEQSAHNAPGNNECRGDDAIENPHQQRKRQQLQSNHIKPHPNTNSQNLTAL